MNDSRPRIMFAAPASGSGKTTLVTGFLHALLARGLKPAAFKCGPDYIDPMFHRTVSGVPGRNLDLFFTPPEIVRGLLREGMKTSDLAVMEGVMGYYDGVGATTRASSWHLAAETKTPVVLVIRPKGAFLSLAAMVKGFLDFREGCAIRGLILNRCGESYGAKLRTMLERETGLPVYGCLPEMPGASVESRHLGLLTPDAVPSLREKLHRLAERMEASLDIAGLVELAKSASPLSGTLPDVVPVSGAPVRIAVARDEAFCFYYEENLDLLRSFGAEIVPFSPLHGTALPDNIDGLYLGGGYPEVHAERLAANAAMRRSVRRAVTAGLPTLAECGGFLYLQEKLEDMNGAMHEMAGALPGVGRNAGRLSRFGYVTLRAKQDTLLSGAGEEMPAHEFHYWDSDCAGEACAAHKAWGEAAWNCVVATDTLFAGFPHLYFWSNPAMAARFVGAAARRRER